MSILVISHKPVYWMRISDWSSVVCSSDLPTIAASFSFPRNPMQKFDGTTILAVRRDGEVALGGDGQVSMGNACVKGNARKVRRLYGDKVLAGFAGGTGDACTLFARYIERASRRERVGRSGKNAEVA